MQWWRAAWLAFVHCLPDDRMFLIVVTAWVALLAVASYVLLGWQGAGTIMAIAGLFGVGAVVVQLRQHRGAYAPPGHR
jgi:hypothetical protein